MLQAEFGTFLIGFTGAMQCEKCGNTSHMHLRQEYSREKFFFVDQGTDFSHVHRVCSICENRVFVGRPKALLRKAELAELHRLLSDGRDQTKEWLRALPEKQMDKVLERYYSLEAFDFMRYVLK
jgi:ribosomal protein S27AE